jgi:hypothetical protein
MSDASSSPPAGDDESHGRWPFIRDVPVLQLKLLLGNVHNFILIPATMAAAALDLISRSGRHGSRFYRVLDWGRRAEEAIGLYSALDRRDNALKRDFTVDAVVSQVEAAVVPAYEQGGTAASMKMAVDDALDKLHRQTEKGTVHAREAAQGLFKKTNSPPATDGP